MSIRFFPMKNRQAALRRRAVKRQIRRLGQPVPEEATYDLRKLRAIRRAILSRRSGLMWQRRPDYPGVL